MRESQGRPICSGNRVIYLLINGLISLKLAYFIKMFAYYYRHMRRKYTNLELIMKRIETNG